MSKPPRERKGQYAPQASAGERVKEAASVRKDSLPRKGGKKGC